MAKRWNGSSYHENSDIDAFLEAIERLCEEHHFSISHEDGQGAFIIEAYEAKNIEWLNDAHDGTGGSS